MKKYLHGIYDICILYMRNILYLLCHPTLTDYEVPLLCYLGYGVLVVKKNSFSVVPSSLDERDHEFFDNFIQIDPHDISVLNNVIWYQNQVIWCQTQLA